MEPIPIDKILPPKAIEQNRRLIQIRQSVAIVKKKGFYVFPKVEIDATGFLDDEGSTKIAITITAPLPRPAVS